MTAQSIWLAVLRAGALVLLGKAIFVYAQELWVMTDPAFGVIGPYSPPIPLVWHLGAAVEIAVWATLLYRAPRLARWGGEAEERASLRSLSSLASLGIGLWCVVRGVRLGIGYAVESSYSDSPFHFAPPSSTIPSAILHLVVGSWLLAVGAGWSPAKWARRWVLAPKPEDLGVVRGGP